MRMIDIIEPISQTYEEEPWFFPYILKTGPKEDQLGRLLNQQVRRFLTVAELKEKVKNGFNLNEQDSEDNTFIHFLIYEHRKYIGGWLAIQLLIDCGARLDIKNIEGLTAIELFEKIRPGKGVFCVRSTVNLWEDALYQRYQKQENYG